MSQLPIIICILDFIHTPFSILICLKYRKIIVRDHCNKSNVYFITWMLILKIAFNSKSFNNNIINRTRSPKSNSSTFSYLFFYLQIILNKLSIIFIPRPFQNFHPTQFPLTLILRLINFPFAIFLLASLLPCGPHTTRPPRVLYSLVLNSRACQSINRLIFSSQLLMASSLSPNLLICNYTNFSREITP